MADAQDAISVSVRIRPLNRKELDSDEKMGWEYNKATIIETTMTGKKSYNFDHVLGPNSMNPDAYEKVAQRVVNAAMEGYNGTVFTYGQTGSGKTHSIMGTVSDPGVIRRSIIEVFKYIEDHPKHEFMLRVSYIEVYNEEINDLLAEQGIDGCNLRILKDDPQKGAIIERLTEEIVASSEQLVGIVARGESNRHYACTEMNATSSRSHTIYRLVIESKPPAEVVDMSKLAGSEFAEAEAAEQGFTSLGGDNGKKEETVRVSYLNLVDLAGSERQKKTGCSGQQLKEGSNINKSLLALQGVIKKLGEISLAKRSGKAPKGADFIPYRDSKLTRILKQSLGGNSNTAILLTMTGATCHHDETVSTLKFGQVCRTIVNKTSRNEVTDDKTLLKQYRIKIVELKEKLQEQQHAAELAAAAEVGAAAQKGIDKAEAEANQYQQSAEDLMKKVRKLELLIQSDKHIQPPDSNHASGGLGMGTGESAPVTRHRSRSRSTLSLHDFGGRAARRVSVSVCNDTMDFSEHSAEDLFTVQDVRPDENAGSASGLPGAGVKQNLDLSDNNVEGGVDVEGAKVDWSSTAGDATQAALNAQAQAQAQKVAEVRAHRAQRKHEIAKLQQEYQAQKREMEGRVTGEKHEQTVDTLDAELKELQARVAEREALNQRLETIQQEIVEAEAEAQRVAVAITDTATALKAKRGMLEVSSERIARLTTRSMQLKAQVKASKGAARALAEKMGDGGSSGSGSGGGSELGKRRGSIGISTGGGSVGGGSRRYSQAGGTGFDLDRFMLVERMKELIARDVRIKEREVKLTKLMTDLDDRQSLIQSEQLQFQMQVARQRPALEELASLEERVCEEEERCEEREKELVLRRQTLKRREELCQTERKVAREATARHEREEKQLLDQKSKFEAKIEKLRGEQQELALRLHALEEDDSELQEQDKKHREESAKLDAHKITLSEDTAKYEQEMEAYALDSERLQQENSEWELAHARASEVRERQAQWQVQLERKEHDVSTREREVAKQEAELREQTQWVRAKEQELQTRQRQLNENRLSLRDKVRAMEAREAAVRAGQAQEHALHERLQQQERCESAFERSRHQSMDSILHTEERNTLDEMLRTQSANVRSFEKQIQMLRQKLQLGA